MIFHPPVPKPLLVVTTAIFTAFFSILLTLAAVLICGLALVACPFVIFWVVWKPSWKAIREGRLP